MVAHSIVQGRVSVTLGKAGPAQTRENGHLPKGIAVLTELVIYYCVTNYPQAYSLKTNNLLSRYAVLCSVAQLCPFVTKLLCPWRFSRQEYWRLPCSPPGSLPNPGVEPRSPPLQVNSWEHTGQVGSLGTVRGYPVLFALWEHYPVLLVLDFLRKVEKSKFYMKSSHFKILAFN